MWLKRYIKVVMNLLKIFILYATVIAAAIAETFFQRQENESVARGESKVVKEEFILFDSDLGVDDAIAILLALRAYELELCPKTIAITCVAGTTRSVKQAAINAAKLLKISGTTDIKIYKGSNYPLVPPKKEVENIFGEDGFGDVKDDDNQELQKPEREEAAVAIVRLINKYPDQIVVVCLGPLTNLAMAILIDPNIINKMRGLVIAGTSIDGSGDVKPGREFNAWYDPYAVSDILQKSSYKNTIIVPLQISEKTTISTEFWNEYLTIDHPFIQFVRERLQYYLKTHPGKGPTFLSSLALCSYLFPEILTTISAMRVTISKSSDARGLVMADAPKEIKYCNVNVITEVDYKAYEEMRIELFS